MQGHDSVEIQADVELGGTEQLFNLMVGRDLQRSAGQEPQICLTHADPPRHRTDGEKKMGKSLGNYIGLNEPAKDMFGKTMRIPDDTDAEWFTLLTDSRPARDRRTARRQSERGEEGTRRRDRAAYHGAERPRRSWRTGRSSSQEKHGDPDNIDE